jgi:hypothetical protein
MIRLLNLPEEGQNFYMGFTLPFRGNGGLESGGRNEK